MPPRIHRSQTPWHECWQPQRGPGFVHLPDWLSTDQCEQLVAEKRARRVHRGRVIYEWRPKTEGRPNEALDTRVYARAALEILGSTVIANLGQRAEELRRHGEKLREAEERAARGESEAPEEEPSQTVRVRRTSNWMRRMRGL